MSGEMGVDARTSRYSAEMVAQVMESARQAELIYRRIVKCVESLPTGGVSIDPTLTQADRAAPADAVGKMREEVAALWAAIEELRALVAGGGGSSGGETEALTVDGIEQMSVGTLENKTCAEVEA